MSAPRYGSVDDYLATLDAVKAATIRAVIDTILAQFPELEARIAWNVPTIHRKGQYVAGICAYQKHLTSSPWSGWVLEDFKERLAGFVVMQKSFQIPVDWEVDADLLRDLVQARLAELD
jgi:uncharacterized protein YdhG (YjbR/CyaY superfamily)